MDELYKIQNVTYNATGGTLKNDKAVIDLTAQQNRLLRYLVLNAGQTLTKEQITAHVWGYDVDSDVSNLIYDTVSAVRRLLKKAGLNGAVTTKTGIGYAFTESVEKIKPTAAKTEETCESLPPVFAESAPKFTLDTVYLLLMGDSMYKKAWFLQSVGYIEKLPPLSLEPGLSRHRRRGRVLQLGFTRKHLGAPFCAHTPKKATAERCMAARYKRTLLDLKQDFQNDSGWRGRELHETAKRIWSVC